MLTLFLSILLAQQPAAQPPDEIARQLLSVKRVFVDRLTGGETAAQMRDVLIASLNNAKLFIVTENQERADMILRGAAEDLVFTDSFSASEGVNIHGGASTGSRSTRTTTTPGGTSARGFTLGLGENESSSVKERKHEAMASVRLVNKDGDVVWSTTQESTGAKFRGATADVADKITRQLLGDVERLKADGRK
jgi:hypothetical protein